MVLLLLLLPWKECGLLAHRACHSTGTSFVSQTQPCAYSHAPPPPPRPIVAENSTVAYICKTCFPLRYEQRLRETEEEKSGWSSILPVFYYNDVVFPGHPLKLHFFEHRYKTMMRRCVEGDRKFAYIPNFTDYEAAVGDVCLRVLFCFFFLAIVFGRCREHGKLSVNPVVDR